MLTSRTTSICSHRILSVTVMQRHLSIDLHGMPEMALFGHPSLLYLPSHVSGESLYNSVDRVAPVLANYHVVLTDAQVRHCLRHYVAWLRHYVMCLRFYVKW